MKKKFKKLTANIIAKKFAAKEAFAKALGTGIGKYINSRKFALIILKMVHQKLNLIKVLKNAF